MEASRLVGGKFKYRLEDLELDSGKNWLKDLQGDKQQLSLLYASAKDVRSFCAALTNRWHRQIGVRKMVENWSRAEAGRASFGT